MWARRGLSTGIPAAMTLVPTAGGAARVNSTLLKEPFLIHLDCVRLCSHQWPMLHKHEFFAVVVHEVASCCKRLDTSLITRYDWPAAFASLGLILGEQLQFMLRAMMRNTIERLACSTIANISVVWQRCANRQSWQAGSTGSSIQRPHKLGIHVFAAVKKAILAYPLSSQYETERQKLPHT
jgi:hypothetical protein